MKTKLILSAVLVVLLVVGVGLYFFYDKKIRLDEKPRPHGYELNAIYPNYSG